MKDITPKAHRCEIGASCPAILEVTPQDLCCMAGGCPAIYEQQDGFLIIGKSVASIPEEIKGRVGQDEIVVWVPRGLVRPGDGLQND